MEQQGLTCRVRVKVPTSESACYVAAEGVGVALLNPITAVDHLCKGLAIHRYTPNFAFHASDHGSDGGDGNRQAIPARGAAEIASRVDCIKAALGPVLH